MAFQNNQLAFQSGILANPHNLAFRNHRPSPIIIDKGQGSLPANYHSNKTVIQHSQADHHLNAENVSGMQFNSLSEDRLSLAVRLAQRDLKKKREVVKSRQRSLSPSPKTTRSRHIPGKEYWDKMQRRSRDPKREKRVLMVKEHDRNRQTKTERTQTPPRGSRFCGGRVPDPSFPVSSNSPPSRDTELKMYPIKKSAPSDQPDKEIERLQREMESYLQQIQVIEQRVITEQTTDFLQPVKSRKKGYLPEEEKEERKQIRSEEQQTRAARQLYVLKQQVREIQNQLIRTAPHKMKHTKKSEIVAKLAAAHRGAVRAIQAFVNNLPHSDLRQGLPTTYQELSLLVRQMSLLSTQLSTDGQSSAHEDLVKMLDKVDDLNKAWCVEVQESSFDVLRAEAESQGRRRKSPIAKQPFAGVKPLKQKRPAFISYRGKENKPLRGVLKKQTHTMRSRTKPQGRDLTPDRKETLRAGIAALLETSDLKTSGAGGQGGVAWNVSLSQSHPPTSKKSLIIPGKLQSQRERIQRAHRQTASEHHFADPTIASTIKSVPQQHHGTALERSFSAPPSPSRGPSKDRVPIQGIAMKSASVTRRTRSQSPEVSRRQMMTRNSSIDQELSNLSIQHQFQKTQSPELQQTRGRSPKRFSGMQSQSPTRLVNDAEMAIRMKLKPLLEKADALASRQEKLMMAKEYSARDKLADKASDAIEMNGDILSDMILEDILRDTAKEYQNIEQENRIHHEAISMQDNPTLETIFQRLEQMEQEQFDIRRRWATLEFEEEDSNLRSRKMKHLHIDDRPKPPTALHIQRNSSPSQSFHKNLAFSKDQQDEPIIFTRSKPAPRFREQRLPQYEESSHHGNLGSHVPAIDISVPRNVVQNVHSNLEKYQRYLHKSAHESLGKFDPWKLVEEVSDQLLEECLREVSEEVEEVNEAIVNQVCKTEFMINSTLNSEQNSPHHSMTHSPSVNIMMRGDSLPAEEDNIVPPMEEGLPLYSPSGAKIVAFSDQPVQLNMSGEPDGTEESDEYDEDEFEDVDDDEETESEEETEKDEED